MPGTGRDRLRAVVTPAAAILASLTCAFVAWAGFANGVEQATPAALGALLPGMTLTIGMREPATHHLQSGVANTAVAVVQLLGLVFGVAVGLSAAQEWFGPLGAAPGDMGDAATLLGAAVAGVALVITLNAGMRDVGWGAAAAVLAVAATGVATPLVGKDAAVFAAALAVGLAGDLFARARRRSPLVVIVPGILMPVPGSTGHESASRLMAGDTVGGVDVAFDTLVTALAIVYGLVVSAAVMPGGRDPPSP